MGGTGRGDVMLVYIGIIDFLQLWTFGKKVAMALKFMEQSKATIPPPAYAHRFFHHFDQALQGAAVPLEPSSTAGLELPREDTSATAHIDPHLQEADAREDIRSYYTCRSSVESRPSLSNKGRAIQATQNAKSPWSSCLSGIFG